MIVNNRYFQQLFTNRHKNKEKHKNIKIYREILTPFLKLATQMLQFVDLSVFRFRNCLWIYYLRNRTWFSLEVCTY